MALQEFYRSYDVHPDGKRFLMLKTGDAEARDLNVIFNWRPEASEPPRGDALSGGPLAATAPEGIPDPMGRSR